MPIYEYWCESCKKKFEVLNLTLIDADLNKECPWCDKSCPKIMSSPFLMDESMRKRILGKGRMPESMERVMRGEDPMTRKKDDFDEV